MTPDLQSADLIERVRRQRVCAQPGEALHSLLGDVLAALDALRAPEATEREPDWKYHCAWLVAQAKDERLTTEERLGIIAHFPVEHPAYAPVGAVGMPGAEAADLTEAADALHECQRVLAMLTEPSAIKATSVAQAWAQAVAAEAKARKVGARLWRKRVPEKAGLAPALSPTAHPLGAELGGTDHGPREDAPVNNPFVGPTGREEGT